MKTFELTIETEKGRTRNKARVIAQGQAKSATDFYNQHLKELIAATQGWDSARATSKQVGGMDSIVSTVYPDDQPIQCDKTGEWTAAPAGNANHEYDPDYVPPRKTYVPDPATAVRCGCGEVAGDPGGGVETGRLDANGNPIEQQCNHPMHSSARTIQDCAKKFPGDFHIEEIAPWDRNPKRAFKYAMRAPIDLKLKELEDTMNQHNNRIRRAVNNAAAGMGIDPNSTIVNDVSIERSPDGDAVVHVTVIGSRASGRATAVQQWLEAVKTGAIPLGDVAKAASDYIYGREQDPNDPD